MMIAGAGVLAHRQHAAGGDVGVLQEVEGDELVVVGGFLVFEDVAQLLQMPRPQIMVDVGMNASSASALQRLAPSTTSIVACPAPFRCARRPTSSLLVGGVVLAERKQRSVAIGGDRRGNGGVHGRIL
jgi:hypothetical protein